MSPTAFHATSWRRGLWSMLALLLAFVVIVPDAEARRLGGGKSFGRQSDLLRQRVPAKPPASAGAAAQRPPATPPSTRGRWLGPIAGLAAGLGLAALASHLGLGEQFGSVLLIGLLAFALVLALRRFGTAGARAPAAQGLGASGADLPFARHPMAAPGGSGGLESRPGRIPEDFDTEGFLRHAKVQFVRLQAVFDAGDLDDLREFTTPEVYGELKLQIDERGRSAQRTDVLSLDAELLGIETGAGSYLASVRFSGLIREEPDAPPIAVDEVWNLSKPADGSSGWMLAGIQQSA